MHLASRRVNDLIFSGYWIFCKNGVVYHSNILKENTRVDLDGGGSGYGGFLYLPFPAQSR